MPDERSVYHVMWRTNRACNFDCDYCFRSGVDADRAKEHPDCGAYSPDHIARCFDNTGKTWRIHMSGGEPFLYPQYVELAKALSRNHYLSINTNLSTPNVHDFAATVPAERVHAVNATMHVAELEKRERGVRDFMERLLHLQVRGFNVRLMYITYPPLLLRMEKDLEYVRSLGAKDLRIKVFRGWHDGKHYPRDYTVEEIALMRRWPMSDYELAILRGKDRFYGRLCTAGQNAFDMSISGDLTRCSTIPMRHGNLFEESCRFDKKPRPCPAPFCNCPYQGMKFATKKRASSFTMFREKLARRAMDLFRR